MAFGEPRPFMALDNVSVAATLTPQATAVGGWGGGILPPGKFGGGYWDGYNWYWLTPPTPVPTVTIYAQADPALTGEVRALREEVAALREELARKRKKKEG